MKYVKQLKILALAAMACTASMAFASTASATTLDTSGGAIKTGTEVDMTLRVKTSTVFENTSGLSEGTCGSSTTKGKTSNETGEAITITLESVTYASCSHAIKTLASGSLSIASTSGRNGTVTSSGVELETEVSGGGVCIFGTGKGTTLGTLDGVPSTLEHATLTMNAIVNLIKTISGFCPSDVRWTGEYTITTPAGLTVSSTPPETTLDTSGGVIKTGTALAAETKSRTWASLEDTGGVIEDSCTSVLTGKTTNETGTSVSGNIESLTWANCNRPTKTLSNGSLSITWTEGRNGRVTGSGSEVETELFDGSLCVYGTGTGTTLGTLDGVASTTEKATLTVNAVVPLIKTISGSCLTSVRWTGEYVITSPAGLTVSS